MSSSTYDGEGFPHRKLWLVRDGILESLLHNTYTAYKDGVETTGHSDHSQNESYKQEDEEIVGTIKELLETRVRPAVAQDGGDIVFHGYDGGIVYLHMRGACAGCPSSTATLRHGIENLLRHFCPEVQEVQAV